MSRWKNPPGRPLADSETPDQRAERVDGLRRAYLAGTLDLKVSVDNEGVDRLLEDLFGGEERKRRSRR